MNVFDPARYHHLLTIVEGNSDSAQTLADKVRDLVLIQIITGELPAGAALTTTAVAKMANVSRTPAARALAELAADGILEQATNQNAVVSQQAVNWLQQCRKLRNLVEPEAAFAAAGQVPAEVLGDLWVLSREAVPSREYDWVPAAMFFDAGLHLAIAQFCGNLPMKVTIRRYWAYKRLAYQVYQPSDASLKPEYEQHVAILKAVAAGDSEAAWKAMVIHLRASSRVRDGRLMQDSEWNQVIQS